MDAERGQASVEMLAGIPALLVAGLLALQLLAAGYSLTLADGAVEAGAMALAAGRPPPPAGRGGGLGGGRNRGPTMLASAAAGRLEEALREAGAGRAAARGRLCWLGLPGGEEGLGELARALDAAPAGSLALAHLPARLWPLAVETPALGARAGLLRADLPGDRALAALAVKELRERSLRARIASR